MSAQGPWKFLVVFAHGRPIELDRDDREGPLDDWPNIGEFDHADLPDGLYLCDVDFVDDGPRDWPGTRDGIPSIRDARLVTVDQLNRYLEGIGTRYLDEDNGNTE